MMAALPRRVWLALHPHAASRPLSRWLTPASLRHLSSAKCLVSAGTLHRRWRVEGPRTILLKEMAVAGVHTPEAALLGCQDAYCGGGSPWCSSLPLPLPRAPAGSQADGCVFIRLRPLPSAVSSSF